MEVPGAVSPTPVDEKKPKVTYPGFSLSDKLAEQFEADHEPKLGDEYAATVRMKVVSLTADEYGSRVQFDLLELDDIAEEQEEGKEDFDKSSGSGSGESEDDTSGNDEAETKVLGYKRKKTEKETPDISAKSLQD